MSHVMWMGLWSVLATAAPSAPAPPPTAWSARAAIPPRIDGFADDVVWAVAPIQWRFYQRKPRAGAPPSQYTTFQVAHDNTALYFLVRCHDRDANAIVGRLTRRDRTPESDRVEIGIDSHLDRRTGYQFIINAAGVQADELRFDDTSESKEWDAVWESEVQQDAHGWTVEVRIPLAELRYSPSAETLMGLQVTRRISRTRETLLWAPVSPSENAWVSRWGVLRGLERLPAPQNVVLTPYVSAGLSLEQEEGEAPVQEARPRMGMDFKHGITSRLTLDATVLPDFGQVEADPVVVNLGQYETSLPEKRLFFLEGQELFTPSNALGWDSGNEVRPFYSRRIGAKRPILGAAKLTGRVGKHVGIAFLDAVTWDGFESGDTTRMSNMSVERVTVSYGDVTQGVLLTQVLRAGPLSEGPPAAQALVASTDSVFRPGHGDYVFSALGTGTMKHEDPDTPPTSAEDAFGPRYKQGAGGKFRAVKEGGVVIGGVEYQLYSPDFDVKDLGYQKRADLQHVMVMGGLRRDSAFGFLNSGSVRLTASAASTFDLLPLYASVGTQGAMALGNKWELEGGISLRPPWRDDLETGDRRVVLARPMTFSSYGSFTSDASKPVVVGGGGTLGRTDHGMATDSYLWVSLTPVPPLELVADIYGGHRDGEVKLVEDTDTSYLFARRRAAYGGGSLKSTVAVTRALSLQLYAQAVALEGAYSHPRYAPKTKRVPGSRPVIVPAELPSARESVLDGTANQDGVLVLQTVVRHEFQPGSVFYLVYFHRNHQDGMLRDEDMSRVLSGVVPGSAEDRLLLKLSFRLAR
ncbi:MAG: DUF5916 domain-containing protein [Myxococcota bacterium]